MILSSLVGLPMKKVSNVDPPVCRCNVVLDRRMEQVQYMGHVCAAEGVCHTSYLATIRMARQKNKGQRRRTVCDKDTISVVCNKQKQHADNSTDAGML